MSEQQPYEPSWMERYGIAVGFITSALIAAWQGGEAFVAHQNVEHTEQVVQQLQATNAPDWLVQQEQLYEDKMREEVTNSLILGACSFLPPAGGLLGRVRGRRKFRQRAAQQSEAVRPSEY